MRPKNAVPSVYRMTGYNPDRIFLQLVTKLIGASVIIFCCIGNMHPVTLALTQTKDALISGQI